MSKKFKYQSDIDTIKEAGCDCPDKELFSLTEKVSYRYVFEDINNKKNFLPQLKGDPSRFTDAGAKKKCDFLSLSMYSKIEGAKNRYAHFNNTFKNFSKTAGTHLAMGNLNENDGMITKEDNNNHFELYEFENVELAPKFQIIEKL